MSLIPCEQKRKRGRVLSDCKRMNTNHSFVRCPQADYFLLDLYQKCIEAGNGTCLPAVHFDVHRVKSELIKIKSVRLGAIINLTFSYGHDLYFHFL